MKEWVRNHKLSIFEWVYVVVGIAFFVALVVWSWNQVGLYRDNGWTFFQWIHDYQELLGAAVAALFVIAAVFVAIRQLSAERKTRYASLLVSLNTEWQSEPYLRCRQRIYEIAPPALTVIEQRKKVREAMSRAERAHPEDYFVLTKPLDFFENLALLIRKRYIDIDDVERTFGAPMASYYCLFEDCIKEMREEPGNEDAYIELKAVVKKLQSHT